MNERCESEVLINGVAKRKQPLRNLNNAPTTKTQEKPYSTAKNRHIGIPSKQEQVILSNELGARMKESREMAGLSQKDAAKRLGYLNSSKLSKIEKGTSPQIQLWVIRKAAIIYDVSCDYLFGVTATMERDDVSHAALRELHAFMFAEFDKNHAKDIAVVTGLVDRMSEVEKMVVLAELQARQLGEIVGDIEILPEWQDVRGGNRLTSAVDRLNHTIFTAGTRYKNIKRDMRTRSGTEHQMSLLLQV